jgi:hypothetical protein
MPLPFYPRGKSPWYPSDRRLGWSPEPVWATWRRENSWPYRDSNSVPSVVQPVASRYTNCAGRAAAQAVSRWFPSWRPFSRPGSMWGLWWTKLHWGRLSPNTSVSRANHHSTNFSIIIINRGWHNRSIGDSSAERTQLDSTPPTIPIKKIIPTALLRVLCCVSYVTEN